MARPRGAIDDSPAAPPRPTTAEVARAFWRIGWLGFGGPAGQVALMHREIVDERRWVDEDRFLHALSYCMVLPGPEAQQLATFIGWLLRGVAGGIVAGALFVLPGFLSILALSIVHVLWGETAAVGGALAGLAPAVVVLVVHALLRAWGRTLRGPGARTTAVLAFVGLFVLGLPFPVVIGAALLAGLLLPASSAQSSAEAHEGERAPPALRRTLGVVVAGLAAWFLPLIAVGIAFGSDHVLAREAVFFSKAATVSFGGAYAVLSYVGEHAVVREGWVTAAEMIAGLGLAETTPGPLIQVVQFVGFLGAFRAPGQLSPWVAGGLGAVVTTWATFAPSFLWILAGAPHVDALRGSGRAVRALRFVAPVVVGVIANLGLWFALHALFGDVRTASAGPLRLQLPVLSSVHPLSIALCGLAAWALHRKLPLPAVLCACALLGAVARLAGD